MARVIQIFKDSNGYLRSAKLTIGIQGTLIKLKEFWKDLCQKFYYFLNRSVFDTSMKKRRKSELVQVNSVIMGEPYVHVPWWRAP